jgi:hypothetical protein
VLDWPKRCKLAHAFLWEHSYKKTEAGHTSGPTWRLSHLAALARPDARHDGDLLLRPARGRRLFELLE